MENHEVVIDDGSKNFTLSNINERFIGSVIVSYAETDEVIYESRIS